MKENYESVWKTYTTAWSEPDREKRFYVLKTILEEECLYQDPHSEVKGAAELTDYMAAFQNSVPGGHFILQDFKTHHNKSLAKWNLLNSAGEKIQEGISYGYYAESGKLEQMTGFFY
tara:strand:- start:93 stop:443 length:351 start_codon:yes stop_codon:yes gene_type:complete